MATKAIHITSSDLTRLRGLIAARRGSPGRDEAHLDALEAEIERAEVVEAGGLPRDVVTMGSRVRVRDVVRRKEAIYTLSFPREADLGQGRLSVLAPLGTALLGYHEGDVIEWRVPGGVRRLKVAAVLYQPEADRESGP